MQLEHNRNLNQADSRTNMSGPRRNVPYSSYSSLDGAVPMTYQQPSSSSGHNNAAMQQGQMYAHAPSNRGNPAAVGYQQGHMSQGYNMNGPPLSSHPSSTHYPITPYTGQHTNPNFPPSVPYPGSHPHAYPQSSGGGTYNMSAGPYAPQQQPSNYPYAAAPPAPYPGQYASSYEVPEGPKQCYNCGRTSTPLWRRDPSTQQVLCNACGLYLQQRREPRPQILIDADKDDDESDSDGDPGGPECSHCHTHQTSVWRRNKEGEQVCNACGVYQRLRGKPRPLELRGKKIKPRAKHSQT